MSHDIFGERFYSLRVPAWHKLGTVNETEQSAVETLIGALQGGFYVEKRPTFVNLNGKQTQTKDFALVRSPLPDDPKERVFGYATNRYTPLQPLDVADLFDEKVGRPVETMGILGRGQRLFLTWTLPESEVREGDSVQYYGFVASGHDSKMGVSLNVVSVRVVCANTWSAAISEADGLKESGKGVIFSGKHTQSNLKYILGEWMSHVQTEAERQADLVNSFFKKLANKPVKNEDEAKQLLYAAFPDPEPVSEYYPESLRFDAEEKVNGKREIAARYRDGILSLFNGAGTEITPDYWGLWNSTTEYFNFAQVAKKPVEASILMGNRARNMNKMQEVLAYHLTK